MLGGQSGCRGRPSRSVPVWFHSKSMIRVSTTSIGRSDRSGQCGGTFLRTAPGPWPDRADQGPVCEAVLARPAESSGASPSPGRSESPTNARIQRRRGASCQCDRRLRCSRRASRAGGGGRVRRWGHSRPPQRGDPPRRRNQKSWPCRSPTLRLPCSPNDSDSCAGPFRRR